jgi:hypothetical protein
LLYKAIFRRSWGYIKVIAKCDMPQLHLLIVTYIPPFASPLFHVTHPPEEQRSVSWFSEKIVLHSTYSLPYCPFKLGSGVSHSILPGKSTSWHVVSLLSPPSMSCCLFLVSENDGVLCRESPEMARSTCDFLSKWDRW